MKYTLPSFRIDKSEFFKGNNSYLNLPDGGFLSTTVGVNVFSKPGLFAQAPALGNSVTASLPQNGVVSYATGYGASTPATVATMVFGSNSGKWYNVNPSTGALTANGNTDSTNMAPAFVTQRTYTIGLTDTVFYNDKLYTTIQNDIVQQNIDGSSIDKNWWITTKGMTAMGVSVPHPMLVYESILYIADGRYLHSVDGSTTTYNVFDCPPNYVITAMTEWNGLIYLVAEPYLNADGQIHGSAKMFSWDGISDSWFEQYDINYRVNAMYVYKNRLFMWTNQFMGQWDGSKIVPLKPVSNQVFKCHITETSDSLLYADGPTIIRFGAPFFPGAPEKFYNYLNSGLGYNWTGIISLQNNNLIAVENGINVTESKNYYISNINTPASSGLRIFTMNPKYFNQPVKPRGVVVELDAPLSNAIIYPVFLTDKGAEIFSTYKSGIISSSDSDQANRYFFEFEYNNVNNTRLIQPRLYVYNAVHIRSVDYYYEPTEKPLDLN